MASLIRGLEGKDWILEPVLFQGLMTLTSRAFASGELRNASIGPLVRRGRGINASIQSEVSTVGLCGQFPARREKRREFRVSRRFLPSSSPRVPPTKSASFNFAESADFPRNPSRK